MAAAAMVMPGAVLTVGAPMDTLAADTQVEHADMPAVLAGTLAERGVMLAALAGTLAAAHAPTPVVADAGRSSTA